MIAAPTIDIRLPKPHASQRIVLQQARRYNVLVCGRRYGKSTIAKRLLVKPALSGLPVAYFCPTYKMLNEMWRDITARCWPLIKDKSEQEHRLSLLTGGVIEMWSLVDADAGRSRKYARAIIDEAAKVQRLEDAWMGSIRPTLADLRGDAWLMSTPRGMDYFYTLFQRGQDGRQAQWASWQRPTADNPYIDPAEIEAMRDDMPAALFAQEVLAEFNDSGLALFRAADIDRAEDGAAGEHAPIGGRAYLGAVDVGRRQDATVINVFDVTQEPYQRVYHERLERVPYPVIQQRIDAAATTYRGRWYVESNGIGDPVIENLSVHVDPFVTTSKSKVNALTALQTLLEHGRIKARWTAQERRELLQYQWDDRDLTQDCVMSLAIAAYHCIPQYEDRKHVARPSLGGARRQGVR